MDAERYRLMIRNQATLRQVNALLVAEAEKVVQGGSDFSQAMMGGFLREIIPGLIDQYGEVNAVAAMKYYDEQRLAALTANPGRRNARRSAERVAAAKLQSAIYVARLPKFDAAAKAEPIIGYSMSLFQQAGFEGMKSEMANALTRAVASYNRDTLLFNSALDRSVIGIQRVAEPNACDFCRTVAFGSKGNRYQPRVTSYAPHWHNHCNCSIETLYTGDKPYRPDYYDQWTYGQPTAKKATEQDAAVEALNTSDTWNEVKRQYGDGFVSS